MLKSINKLSLVAAIFASVFGAAFAAENTPELPTELLAHIESFCLRMIIQSLRWQINSLL